MWYNPSARVITNLFHDEATLFLMRMRAFVPSCYNNPQAAYSFSKVLWFCQLYPRESSLLGMEKENIPPTKKAKVSLSLKKSWKPRFQPVSEDKLKGMTVPYVPKNTEQSNKWAMTNFREWFDRADVYRC